MAWHCPRASRQRQSWHSPSATCVPGEGSAFEARWMTSAFTPILQTSAEASEFNDQLEGSRLTGQSWD